MFIHFKAVLSFRSDNFYFAGSWMCSQVLVLKKNKFVMIFLKKLRGLFKKFCKCLASIDISI